MQLPSSTSSFTTRVRVGRYVARKLKTAGNTPLAADVTTATLAIKAAGRNVEDREDEVQDPLADRDAADEALDRTAQEARNALAGRSPEAVKTPPYINIFPDGIAAYTAAPLDAEVPRYNELKTRIEKELGAQDAVRAAASSAISTHLASFTAASTAVAQARTALSLAQTDLDRATDAWERLLEKVYGTLIADLGKKRAEAYFPKAARNRASEGDDS